MTSRQQNRNPCVKQQSTHGVLVSGQQVFYLFLIYRLVTCDYQTTLYGVAMYRPPTAVFVFYLLDMHTLNLSHTSESKSAASQREKHRESSNLCCTTPSMASWDWEVYVTRSTPGIALESRLNSLHPTQHATQLSTVIILHLLKLTQSSTHSFGH